MSGKAHGLVIAGVPKAASPGDVLISRKGADIRVIGTGSPRRVLECKRFYPNAAYENIRGNVDTRLRKLRDGEYDGIVLANKEVNKNLLKYAKDKNVPVLPYHEDFADAYEAFYDQLCPDTEE